MCSECLKNEVLQILKVYLIVFNHFSKMISKDLPQSLPPKKS